MTEQAIIDHVVRIATREALNHRPVERILHAPPDSASSDPMGRFVIQYPDGLLASDTAPWDK
jgi:hypothetical protein